MILADQHVHSHHSGDSRAPMEEEAEAAIRLGLKSLTFTEHQDACYPRVEDREITPETFLLDADAYEQEYRQIREAYAGRITLRFGVELGLQTLPAVVEDNRAFVSRRVYDLVIGSVHVVGGRDVYYPSFYKGRTEEAAIREYLTEMLADIRAFEDFDVLGHLDYIIRYLPSGRQEISMEPFRGLLDEILSLLVRRGQGLDVNTSPLWKKGYPQTNPSLWILRRFHELGGKVITFGSDAHAAGNLAGEFARAEEIARAAGFRQYCVFNKRKPTFMDF